MCESPQEIELLQRLAREHRRHLPDHLQSLPDPLLPVLVNLMQEAQRPHDMQIGKRGPLKAGLASAETRLATIPVCTSGIVIGPLGQVGGLGRPPFRSPYSAQGVFLLSTSFAFGHFWISLSLSAYRIFGS